MKPLIAIKSCAFDRDRGAHQLILDTWGQNITEGGLKFFTAREGTPDFNEVIIKSGDSYKDLPFKTREIIRWSLENGYDYIFLCDTGSFVIPHHFELCGLYKEDYVGYWGLKSEPFYFEAGDMNRGCRSIVIPNCYPWGSGGGYGISKKSMEILAISQPVHWAEDCNTGQILATHGIFLEDRAKDGYNGYIVTWIHGENNSRPDAMERRRKWMEERYRIAKERCAIGCNSPAWDRRPVMRGEPRLEQLEQTLELRRKMRHGE